MFTLSLSTLFTVTVLHFLEPLYIYVYIFSQVLDGGMMKIDGYESQTSSDIHQRSSWNDHI